MDESPIESRWLKRTNRVESRIPYCTSESATGLKAEGMIAPDCKC